MDHGIESSQPVDLSREPFRLLDARQLRAETGLRAREGGHGVGAALTVAGVEDDLVALGDEEAGRHLADAVGGAGYEDTCHG